MATFQKVKLGEIAQVIDCPHSTPKWVDDGIFAVRNFNLSNGKIVKEKISYVDEVTFTERTRRAVPKKGDCILSREAPIGSVGYVNTNEKMCLGQRVVLIQPNDNIDSRFLLYQLLSSDIQNQFRQSDGSGSTVSNLRIPLIKNTKISSTDIDSQKIISSTIGTYDDLIENNEKRIKALEEMAQLLYTEWFVKFKFPGHEKVKMVDSGTEYGLVPEGWEVKKFYDIVDNFDSKRKPISSMKRQEMQGKYPYYGAAKVIDYVNDYIFDGRYLLIAEDGSVITPDGKPMLQFVDEKFWVSNHAHIVQGKLLSTEILYLRLRRFNIKPLITGSAQPKITKDNLSRVLFIIPDDSVKNMFTVKVGHYFDKIFNLQKQKANLRQFRDLLLPELICGKVDLDYA